MKGNKYYKRKGYISNSSLSWLEKSPEKFRQFINGELEEVDTSYLSFGRLVHMHILENDLFQENIVPYEYETPKSPQQKNFIEVFRQHRKANVKVDEALVLAYKDNYKTKEKDETVLNKAKELREKYKTYEKYLKASETKEIIKQADYDRIKSIDRALRSHKKAKELLFGVNEWIDDGKTTCFNEFEILWDFENVKCKSLVDRIVVDKENKKILLIDVKTTSDISNFKSSFNKYRYDRQLAFYSSAILHNHDQLLEKNENIDDYNMECYIVAVDTITCNVKVFGIKNEPICTATKEIVDLLRKADWHISNNKWEYSKEYYEGDGTEEL